MDGVLVDTEEFSIRASKEVLARHGMERTPEELSRVFGRRTLDNYRELIESRGVDLRAEDLVAEKEEYYFELVSGNLEPKEGVVELIMELKSNAVKVAVVSSSGMRRVEKTLSEIGLSGEFEVIVTGDCCVSGKPDPDPFLHAAEKLGVEPKECIVIEDAEAGVLAAKAAGMKVVGVDNPNTLNQDLEGVDLMVDGLSEVNLSVLNSL